MSTGMPEAGLTVMRAVAGPLFLRSWDVNQRGVDLVPQDGPVIIASNHVGWVDGPLLVASCPRKLHVLTKSEEFSGKYRHLLRALGQIKVERKKVDAGALRRAVSSLEAGQAVGIFPEGIRGAGELKRFKHGVAWLALVTGAPVVPLAIFGTRKQGEGPEAKPAKGARLDLVYGQPIQLDARPWPRDRDMIDDAATQIQSHMRDHLVRAKTATSRELPGPLPAGAWT